MIRSHQALALRSQSAFNHTLLELLCCARLGDCPGRMRLRAFSTTTETSQTGLVSLCGYFYSARCTAILHLQPPTFTFDLQPSPLTFSSKQAVRTWVCLRAASHIINMASKDGESGLSTTSTNVADTSPQAGFPAWRKRKRWIPEQARHRPHHSLSRRAVPRPQIDRLRSIGVLQQSLRSGFAVSGEGSARSATELQNDG